MALYYVDTSALVKRYHLEQGSDRIDRLFADAGAGLVMAGFALTELTSALDRKCQEGLLTGRRFSSGPCRSCAGCAGRILVG